MLVQSQSTRYSFESSQRSDQNGELFYKMITGFWARKLDNKVCNQMHEK